MKLARQLERRIEQLVEGVAGKVFPGPLHPVELTARLLREADLAVSPSPAGPITANVFRVGAHPKDLAGFEAGSLLAVELARVVDDEAAQRGWRLEGPVVVEIYPDPEIDAGSLSVTTSVSAGPLPPWANLIGRGVLPVCFNRVVMGRSRTADVVINAPEVSRVHALLWREAGRTWVEDLGSTNGTFVDGRSADRGSPSIAEGGVLSLGGLQLTFRLV